MEIRIDPNKAAGLYEAVCKDMNKKNGVRAAGESFDKISISPEAQKYARAAEFSGAVKAALGKDTDAGRIADIKRRIALGAYEVSVADIADAILKGAGAAEA